MTPLRVSIFAAVAALLLLLGHLRADPPPPPAGTLCPALDLHGDVILVLALWRSLLGKLSDVVGIAYPPSALFILAAFFILVVLLHYSTVISKLSDQNRVLAQRLALLQRRLEERESGNEPHA